MDAVSEELNQESVEPEGADEIDPMKVEMLLQEIRDNQNLLMGIVGGVLAAAAGAAIWAVITAFTGYQIGFMAVGVGLLVGFAVRLFGKGIDKSFGIVGAVLALLGCLAGNILTACIFIARHGQFDLFDVIMSLDLMLVVDLLQKTFSPIDLLFYGIAVYEGYQFSFRRLSEEDLAKLA
jgi:hypothetical protein